METVCVTCSKVIQGKILTALGKSYHPEHFQCKKCNQPITGTKFQENNGDPYCERDYTELFSKRCRGCTKPIKEKVISALGFDWHEEHFTCAACKKLLAGQSFFERDGLPYCREDFLKKFADKCVGCRQAIADKAIVALNGKWHQDCFRCKKCDKPVVEEAFQVDDGRPVCSKCAS